MTLVCTPKNSVMTKAVEVNRFFSNFVIRAVMVIVWALGFISIGMILARLLFPSETISRYTAPAFMVAAVFLVYLALRSFYYHKLTFPKLVTLEEAEKKIADGDFNLYSIFSFELARATYTYFLKNGMDGTNQELGKAVLESNDAFFILSRLGIGKAVFLEQFSKSESQKNVPEILVRSAEYALAEGHHEIEVGDLFCALCEKDPVIAAFLTSYRIDLADIANVVYWQTKLVREYKDSRQAFNPQKLRFTGGLGRDWAYGFANNIKYFSTDLSSRIKDNGSGFEVIGRENEISQIKEALLRDKGGNAILVGDEGAGKSTTVFGFIKKLNEGKTGTELDYKHVFELRTDLLLDTSDPGEITTRITNIFNEILQAGNIILLIENIHTLFSSGDAGKVNATDLMLSMLDAPGIHIIGTTDIVNYNKFINANSGLSSKLSLIKIEEPEAPKMIRILEDAVPAIEYHTRSIITYEAIKETIKLADKYITNVPNPEKSISLLEGAATKAASGRGKSLILPQDIAEYISEKYEIPAGEAGEDEKEKLLALEEIMHKDVVGQEEAIKAIANAMRRSRAGVEAGRKPIGSFLFLGPTGVGKTETAKALAEAYFGSKDKMIRFDMSEYKTTADLYRFIGSNANGENTPGVLTSAVREHPFSLLLFDEIEKASREILDLFLQILDEGFVTDGMGQKAIFSNNIIIATSNAGANLIRESIQNNISYEQSKKALLEYLQKENIYRPEFLNRFSSIVAFSPLSEEQILRITQLILTELSDTIKKNKGITLTFSSDVLSKLVQLGYDREMGARPMQRIIAEKIEDLLAKKILTGELNAGSNYQITTQDIQ